MRDAHKDAAELRPVYNRYTHTSQQLLIKGVARIRLMYHVLLRIQTLRAYSIIKEEKKK